MKLIPVAPKPAVRARMNAAKSRDLSEQRNSLAHMPGETSAPASPMKYSRSNPFPATVVINRKLTGEGSAKDTRHIELSLRESGLSYEVGDSMTVYPANCPELVEEILRAKNFSGVDGGAACSGLKQLVGKIEKAVVADRSCHQGEHTQSQTV